MIQVIGNYDGKVFDGDKPVSARELATIFNIPIDGRKEIELPATRIRTDHFGSRTVPSSVQIPCFFTVNSPKGTFSYRYYESKQGGGKFAEDKFLPVSLVFHDSGRTFDDSELEQFITFYIFHWCAQSPFNKGTVYYEYKDRVGENIAKMNATRRVMGVSNEIVMFSENQLRILAYGMVTHGFSFGHIEQMDGEELRYAVITAFQSNAERFIEKKGEAETLIIGTLRTAIEKGIVTQGVDSGKKVWAYASGERSGSTICRITTDDAFISLAAYARLNYNEVLGYLTPILVKDSPKLAAAGTVTSVKDLSDSETMVRSLISEGRLTFEIGTGSVILLDLSAEKSEVLNPQPIADKKNWIVLFATMANGDPKILKKLKIATGA